MMDVVQFLRDHFGRPLWETLQRWQKDDGPLLAGAMAYYLAISLFPLLLILISALGALAQYTRTGAITEEQILSAIARQGSAALAENVETAFERVKEGAPAGGPIGAVTLLLAAMAIFAQFERAFDKIWNIPPRPGQGLWRTVRSVLVVRFRAFLMLLGIGLFVVLVFVSSLVLSSLQAYSQHLLPGGQQLWWWIELGISLVLNAAAFTMVYKMLPKVPIRWPEAARGAVVAAITWEAGRQVLADVVIGARYTSAYGVVGALLAVMLWAYYAVTVVFLGAEYIQTLCSHCGVDQEVSI